MKKEFDLFDRPEVIKKIKIGYFIFIAFLFIAELFIHKHGHFHIEDVYSFYPIFGFVGCAFIIFFSKAVGNILLLKKEDYYDNE